MRVAVVGGGIAGVTAAWQLARLGAKEVTLYEASHRLGGTVETVRRGGFIIEGGPDGWVTEKPWARELADELGLGGEIIGSNDAERVTYIVQSGRLVAMPDGMRMMVPTELAALESSPLFSNEARSVYAQESMRADELRALAPDADESVAAFVRRHFGDEVLAKIGGPLLSGVFGGDVTKLSVRAVMPRFVEMEQEHGSLVTALAGKGSAPQGTVFTTLKSGVGTLVERMAAAIPKRWVRYSTPVSGLRRTPDGWRVNSLSDGGADRKESFDIVMLAVPAHVARSLLAPVSDRMGKLLEMEASSAVLAALAFDKKLELPKGFGFLAPEGEGSGLLAGTFVDQKFDGRAPAGCRLLRGFFSGELALSIGRKTDEQIASRTLEELRALLGPLPEPKFSVVRRWPKSLPQYEVGHLARMAELDGLVREERGLRLLGNAYRGVGLPDLIGGARAAVWETMTA